MPNDSSVFARADIVGGFLETIGPNNRWAGPIVSIRRFVISPGDISIACRWTARFDLTRDRWVMEHGGANGMYAVAAILTVPQLENGKILFSTSRREGSYVIHLKGGWSLALEDVLDETPMRRFG